MWLFLFCMHCNFKNSNIFYISYSDARSAVGHSPVTVWYVSNGSELRGHPVCGSCPKFFGVDPHDDVVLGLFTWNSITLLAPARFVGGLSREFWSFSLLGPSGEFNARHTITTPNLRSRKKKFSTQKLWQILERKKLGEKWREDIVNDERET